MKTRITRRYLAGLMDGEGYISIRPDINRQRQHYKPVIKIGLSDKFAYILFEIKELLGGHIHKREHSFQMNYANLFTWEVQTFEAVKKVLDYVKPYLILKKEQADIVYELIKTKINHDNGVFYKVPPHILEKRLRLYNLVRKLNKRGRAPAETKREPPALQGEVIVRPSEKSEEIDRNINPQDKYVKDYLNEHIEVLV